MTEPSYFPTCILVAAALAAEIRDGRVVAKTIGAEAEALKDCNDACALSMQEGRSASMGVLSAMAREILATIRQDAQQPAALAELRTLFGASDSAEQRTSTGIDFAPISTDEYGLTAGELEDKYSEHPQFSWRSWAEEVAAQDTYAGYWVWVADKVNVEHSGQCSVC